MKTKKSITFICYIIIIAGILIITPICPPAYSLWNIPENIIGEENNSSEEFGVFTGDNEAIDYKIGQDWANFPHKLYRQPHNPHIVHILFDTNTNAGSQNLIVAVCTYAPSQQTLVLYFDGYHVGKQDIQESHFEDFIFYLGTITQGMHRITIMNETDPEPDPFWPRYGIFFDYIQLVPSSGTIINIPADYPSITLGIKNANPGDIIRIEEGEYPESKLSLKSGLTLIADNPHETIINGGEETVIFGAYKSTVKGLALKTTGNIGLVNDYDFMSFSNNIVVAKEKGIFLTGQNFSMINNTIISGDCSIYIRKASVNAPIPSITCRNNILSNSILPFYIDTDIDSIYRVDPNDVDQVIHEFNFNNTSSEYIPFLILSEGRFGNISLNPYFIDPNSGNYQLMPYSPCIDAGDPLSDYFQEPNDNGQRINMGAFGNTLWAARSLDSDGDGVKDYREGPEDRDLNGQLDCLDSQTTVFRSTAGDKEIWISLVTDSDLPALKKVKAIKATDPNFSGFIRPITHLLYGFWGFTIIGIGQGTEITVNIHFPQGLFDIQEYLTYHPKNGWKNITMKQDLVRSIISIELVDGSAEDMDSEINGSISHIGGLSVPYPFHGEVESSSCFISAVLREFSFYGYYNKKCKKYKDSAV